MIGVVAKLQERNPLCSSLVRCASAINPTKMATESEACIIKFDALVDRLHQHDRLTDSQGDEAKSEFRDFMQKVVCCNKDVFLQYDFTTTRLDEFLFGYVTHLKRYQHLWKVMIFIFVLSHGQAVIERGFNVNNEVLEDNLQENTLKYLRLVYDQITTTKKKIHEIPIPRELIISCKEASKKYKAAQDEKAKQS